MGAGSLEGTPVVRSVRMHAQLCTCLMEAHGKEQPYDFLDVFANLCAPVLNIPAIYSVTVLIGVSLCQLRLS